MPSRSAWESLTDSASNAINNGIDKAKSVYSNAKAVNARGAADKLAADRASSAARTTPMASAPAPVTPIAGTSDLSAQGAVNKVSGAPSQIDKAIASMDH